MSTSFPLALGDDDQPPRFKLFERLIQRICAHSPEARSYRRIGQHRDLLAWGRHYLPAYFRQPPSKMHTRLAQELAEFNHTRGGRLNVLAPRGGAKSTLVTLAYVLRCALEEREPYIWVVSATRDQARQHMHHIRTELETNPRLAQDYPDATGRGLSWRAGSLHLNNGVLIEAYGMCQQVRGRRHNEHRPSLIVCDDLENDIHVASPVQRAACREWFQGTLLKAGNEQTNVISLATALHRDALAMTLHRSPAWKSTLYRALQQPPTNIDLWQRWEDLYVNCDDERAAQTALAFFQRHRAAMEEGADVLWPEKESLYALMQMRASEGRATFEREKQNSPIDPERCEWPGEYFDHHIWCEVMPKKLVTRVMALDPSKGADSKFGDYSAYVMLGVDAHGLVYVEADLARRPTPEMVADGVVLSRRFDPQRFGIESSLFHDLLENDFHAEFTKQRRRRSQLCAIDNHVNKHVRIRRIGPYLAQHRLRFVSRSASTHLLVEQLRDFPIGDHDDGPDALEMALRLAEELMHGTNDDGLGDRLIAA
jgi:predicted phage terminase large subunit-like protein